MRLWHYKLIPYLPKSQLVAQWRELNSVFNKQDNHILINYIYNYDKSYLYEYSNLVKDEMFSRGYKINKWDNYMDYFRDVFRNGYKMQGLIFSEHDNEYLTICYYNLKEKYIRGQKDFTDDVLGKLEEFYKEEIK